MGGGAEPRVAEPSSVDTTDDRELDRQSGDFAAWVAPDLGVMANLAARLVGTADRDDVVQEALTRAWRRWATYRPDRGAPRAWLLAIVADQSRRARRRSRLLRADPPVQLDHPYDMDLEGAIAKLPRRQRLTIELFYLVDLSVTDVAAVLGCSEGSAKSNLFDARASLRHMLEEDQ